MSEDIAGVSIERLRKVAERIGREYGCRLIVLFGSASRGEARPADLDIAVLRPGGLDPVAITNRLIHALEVQQIDVADLSRADPLLMILVARDGTPLFESEPGEFARFASLAARRFADTRKFREMERQEIRDFIARSEATR